MKSFWEKYRKRIDLLGEQFQKWRWVILALFSLSLLGLEIKELLVLKTLSRAFHYFEILLNVVLLICIGLLVELFIRSKSAHQRVVKVLEYKHRFSLEFTSSDEWESLATRLAELPGRIADVEESYLLIGNPISTGLEISGHWTDSDTVPNQWDPLPVCRTCQNRITHNDFVGELHEYEAGAPSNVYCLEISSAFLPVSYLRFRLKTGSTLMADQAEIFNNIKDEIFFAIQASQDRGMLSEMRAAETAMAERRNISAYVHDLLGQNLGYIHLKLDQLVTNNDFRNPKEVKANLNHLRDVADESYEIVRDILKKMQPESIPHLTNLLKEHATTVSRRAKLALNFKSIGKPIPLLPETQQIIFYAFREILSNIEKHAGASQVDALVIWNDDILDISVTDNGIGFDPRAVPGDEHFGLEIMQERIRNIRGRITINSRDDSGTAVSISIPVKAMEKDPV